MRQFLLLGCVAAFLALPVLTHAADEMRLGAAVVFSMDVLDNNNSLQLGDELSLRILEDHSPALGLTVLSTGEIDAPYVGKIKAVGLTSSQLAYKLKSKLQQRFFFRTPLFRKPLLRKATVIVCIDKLAHPQVMRCNF